MGVDGSVGVCRGVGMGRGISWEFKGWVEFEVRVAVVVKVGFGFGRGSVVVVVGGWFGGDGAVLVGREDEGFKGGASGGGSSSSGDSAEGIGDDVFFTGLVLEGSTEFVDKDAPAEHTLGVELG